MASIVLNILIYVSGNLVISYEFRSKCDMYLVLNVVHDNGNYEP